MNKAVFVSPRQIFNLFAVITILCIFYNIHIFPLSKLGKYWGVKNKVPIDKISYSKKKIEDFKMFLLCNVKSIISKYSKGLFSPNLSE